MQKEKVKAITRQGYKENSATDVLTKFRLVENHTMNVLVIFILAYITTDEENAKVNEDDDHIRTIVGMLSEVKTTLLTISRTHKDNRRNAKRGKDNTINYQQNT